MLDGKSLPNPATWFLWAFLAVLNAATYRIMTCSTVASIQTFGGAAANLTTFLLALKFGKFDSMSKLEKFLLISGAGAGLFWAISRNATWASMLIVLCFNISIIPTWISVYRRPGREHPRAWLGWGTSYAIQIVALALLRERPEAYVLPVLAGSSQLAVGLLALRKTKQTPSFKPWRTIWLGTRKSIRDLVNDLIRVQNHIGAYMDEILYGIPVSPTRKRITLYCATVAELGFHESATWPEIWARLDELGYGKCPSEVGIQLRLQSHRLRLGIYWIVMEPMVSTAYNLEVLRIDVYPGGWQLTGDSGYHNVLHQGPNHLVFCEREDSPMSVPDSRLRP